MEVVYEKIHVFDYRYMRIRLVDSCHLTVEAGDEGVCYYHYEVETSDELQSWLADSLADNDYTARCNVYISTMTLIFHNEESAMAFILRFS